MVGRQIYEPSGLGCFGKDCDDTLRRSEMDVEHGEKEKKSPCRGEMYDLCEVGNLGGMVG